ncbi:MAG TPA: glycosyltransferase family 2 protein [Intrasporangiaceae bacterium]|nr:glycosyltransferase family 2 protein [Intrasporangiaceae bacterium]
MSDARPLISYVFPIYHEEGNIDLLHERVGEAVATVDVDAEFIFVNDGSTDGSLDRLIALSERDERVVVVDLARNFGHQMAVTAGIDHARGDAVIIMDADLQDPPAVSLELIREWQDGWDVVYAQRRTRKDGAFKRATADLFYRVLGAMSTVEIPRNTGDFRLIDRAVADQLRRYGEHSRFLRGMVSEIGFKQKAVLFDRDARHSGTTGYPLRKMIRFAIDGITSFSAKPLQLISRAGLVVSFLALLGMLYAVGVRLFFPEQVVEGWTFIVTAVFLVGGLQLLLMGIIGTYIGRIYDEVKGRPLYGVQEVYRDGERRLGRRARPGRAD